MSRPPFDPEVQLPSRLFNTGTMCAPHSGAGLAGRLLILGGIAALACAPVQLHAQQTIPEIKRAPTSAVQAVDLRPKTTTSKSSGDSKDTAKKTARDAAADNQQAAPEGGPDAGSKTGTKNERATPSLGGRSQTTPEDALKAGSSATSGRPKATLTPDNGKRPDFDQGFGEKRVSVPADAAGGGNPMKSLTSGGLTGPLADAANRSSGVNGIASQGRGAISEGTTPTPGVTSAGGAATTTSGEVVLTDEQKARAKALEQSTGLDGKKVADFMTNGGDKHRGEQMNCALYDDCSSTTPGTTPTKDPDPVHEDKVTKDDLVDNGGKKVGERITHVRSDGSITVIDTNSKTGKTTITHWDTAGKKTKETLSGEPDEETRYRKDKDTYVREKMADRNWQIVQEAKDNGTVNPDRNDHGGGRVAGAVAPSQSAMGQSMFGNPGQRGGMGESGAGRTGIDFNGNAGAIDPGDEATVTAGNRQQDPGAFFDRGGGPTQGIGSNPNAKSDDDEDDEEDESKDEQNSGTAKPR